MLMVMKMIDRLSAVVVVVVVLVMTVVVIERCVGGGVWFIGRWRCCVLIAGFSDSNEVGDYLVWWLGRLPTNSRALVRPPAKRQSLTDLPRCSFLIQPVNLWVPGEGQQL